MSGDFDFEPIRGIPASLPRGEDLLWQGAPRWQSIATHVFHVRAIAAYFATLLGWRLAAVIHDGGSIPAALVAMLPVVGLALVAVALLSGIAWLIGRTTVYSITSKRVFFKIGVALPITLNIPFKAVGSASLKQFADGTGSIPLSLAGRERIAYLVLWPHARPWRKQVFPITLDIDNPKFRAGMERPRRNTEAQVAARAQGGFLGRLKRAGLTVAAGATFFRMFLLTPKRNELPGTIRLSPAW